MKNLIKLFITLPTAFALALAVVALAGCSTSGYKKGDATAASLQDGSSVIAAECRALTVTIETMDDLVNRPAPDPRPQFKRFSRSLDDLVSSAAEADAAVKRIRQRSVDYLAAWDANLAAMGYDVVRDNSTARKTAVSNQLETVCGRYEENQAVVGPLISYLQDIHKALAVDLTREGLEAVKPIVRNAGENSRKVQTALAQLTTELMASEGRLSSTAATIENSQRTAPGAMTENSRSEAAIH